MDTGEGRFIRLDNREFEYLDDMRKKYPKSKGVFIVGEEIEIRGEFVPCQGHQPVRDQTQAVAIKTGYNRRVGGR